jgi:hypothetical protein
MITSLAITHQDKVRWNSFKWKITVHSHE